MLARVLLVVVLVLLVTRELRRFLRAIAQGMGTRRDPPPRIDEGVRMARDPVCGTFVIPGSALAVRDAAGIHHFCSTKCRDAFVARARRSS